MCVTTLPTVICHTETDLKSSRPSINNINDSNCGQSNLPTQTSLMKNYNGSAPKIPLKEIPNAREQYFYGLNRPRVQSGYDDIES